VSEEQVEIRAATEEDLPRLIELQSQLTPSSLEAAVPVFRKMKQYPNYKIYLAIEGAEPVGTFALLIKTRGGAASADR
jgi:hypothetical protein